MVVCKELILKGKNKEKRLWCVLSLRRFVKITLYVYRHKNRNLDKEINFMNAYTPRLSTLWNVFSLKNTTTVYITIRHVVDVNLFDNNFLNVTKIKFSLDSILKRKYKPKSKFTKRTATYLYYISELRILHMQRVLAESFNVITRQAWISRIEISEIQ